MGIINENFMLKNKTAEKLYHEYAENLPIIDYHCHLKPAEIAEDHKFEHITELMLGGDHYKWRFMRSAGVDEELITGAGDPREKFRAWARVLPYGIGNPLYHWTHLELKRYFGIDDPLTEDNADEIYDATNAMLAKPEFSARSLVTRSNVKVVCTTDDPVDDLAFHKEIAATDFATKVLPTFRPDKAVNIELPTFADYIASCGVKTYEELLAYMVSRIDFFHAAGARLSDHGLGTVTFDRGDAAAIFEKRMNGGELTEKEISAYHTELLIFFGREYAKRGWTMQLHVGATRNNNTRMFRKLGPDTGYDSVGDTNYSLPLAALLDALEVDDLLPKTILYTVNPKDLQVLGAMLGNFQKGPDFGKIQLGSGWWFLDTRDGMETQMKTLGNLGCLGSFVGMLTDSRSFVSYPRHEYFRRIMCNLIGTWVEEGEYPMDEKHLKVIVQGISYENANRYFGF